MKLDPTADADTERWLECEFIARFRRDDELNEVRARQAAGRTAQSGLGDLGTQC